MAEASGYALRQVARGAARAATARTARRGRAGPSSSIRAVSSTTVLSDLPGRARFHVLGLRGDAARVAALATELRGTSGVRTVDVSVLTGNVLVRYDASDTTLARIQAVLAPPARRRGSARRTSVGDGQLALVGL